MPQDLSLNFTPLLPQWAIAILAAALCLLLLQGSRLLLRKKVPPRWVAILGVLRMLIIAVLILCVLQPVVSFIRVKEQLPDLLVLIDTSQSMGIKASAKGSSRLDVARAALLRAGLLDRLKERYNVHWFAFDRDARPIVEESVKDLAANGDATRYAASLSTAAAHVRQAESGNTILPSSRVLLVSDGDEVGGGEDVVSVARSLGVSIDTLAPDAVDGDAVATGKIVIASVQSPRSVKVGSEMQVVATLRSDGKAIAPQPLSLLEAGKSVASERVAFAAGEFEKTVRLFHRPAKTGLGSYQLALPAESSAKPYDFTVNVVDDKNQVLVLEDNWRWELKFLRQVVEDDPSFSFTAFLSRSGGGGMHVQLAEADRKVTLAGFPQGAADLSFFDTIVLGDVNPQRWPPMLAGALAAAVKEGGKSLVVIAGPNLARIADIPELQGLLPVEVTGQSSVPLEGPIDVRVSREGAVSSFFSKLQATTFPPLDRIYPPLRKRPAAAILLEAQGQVNAYGNLIVMAEHTVGRGRVLFIGTDALWNWQMTGALDAQGATPYAIFWQQALRALAPARRRTGDVSLQFEPARSRYTVGERVDLVGRYQSLAPLISPAMQATITLPDQKQLPLVFTADPAQPNSYRAEFEAVAAGRYTITGSVGVHGKPAAADAQTTIDVAPPPGEMDSTGINRTVLTRIAAETNGHSLSPADPSTWPTAAEAQRAFVRKAGRLDLWGNLTLLIVLGALLGIDWFIRLMRGYT